MERKMKNQPGGKDCDSVGIYVYYGFRYGDCSDSGSSVSCVSGYKARQS